MFFIEKLFSTPYIFKDPESKEIHDANAFIDINGKFDESKYDSDSDYEVFEDTEKAQIKF